jgi:hypothetical protein
MEATDHVHLPIFTGKVEAQTLPAATYTKIDLL